MPARDPLELRKHAPTVPKDLDDPARFAQFAETTKDALVEELRVFFAAQGFTGERVEEAPTVQKYAVQAGGLDPYQTFASIVADNPDVKERFPHVAITTASGQNRRRTAGLMFIAHTQAPPRVVTATPGPYALANPTAQVVRIDVVQAPANTYVVEISGETVTVTLTAGTMNDAATELAAALRTHPVIGQSFDALEALGTNPYVAVRARSVGVSFAVTTSNTLSAVTTTPAGNATGPSTLVYRTWPPGKTSPVTSMVRFLPSRLAPGESIGAVPAAAVARIFNEQALYAKARTIAVGAGVGVQFETGGPLGGETPNEIEILSTSSADIVAALGLAQSGNLSAGGAITGLAPNLTLQVTGAVFTATLIGRYVTIDGTTSNDGRFLVTGAAGDTLTYENPDGTAEAVPAATTYFLGLRDDWRNPDRPMMNRYHAAMQLAVNVDIQTESPNTRRELVDLVLAEFVFFLEQKHFTFWGRGIFEPDAYPDEHYQISINQEVSLASESSAPRGEDQKNHIHIGRLVVALTTNWYIDRPVLVPYGPDQGKSWVVTAADVSHDETLPLKS